MLKPLKAVSFWTFYVCIILVLLMFNLLSGQKKLLIDVCVDETAGFMDEIYDASLRFISNKEPGLLTFETLEKFNYLIPYERIEKQWNFTFYLPDSIVAVSTSKMPGGSDKRLTYDLNEEIFMGYNCPKYGRMVEDLRVYHE